MTPITAGSIGLGVLFILLFSGMPLGFVMALTGFAGFAYLSDFNSGLALLGSIFYRTFSTHSFSVAPLFVLMGELCFAARLTGELYDTAHKWIGQFRGGLAMATIGACSFFSAVSGSSVACAATMGTVALPEMKRYKYDSALATGCVAAGGTLDIMIPPSITFIVYGIITEQSIGKLFIAGILPGILLATFFIITIIIVCKRNPLLGLPGTKTSFREKIISLKNTWIVFLLFLLIMGGIYLGFFSPTEAGGVGACGAFAFALARRRLSLQAFQHSIYETVKLTSMVFMIIAGAMVFGYFLAVSRIPSELATMILGMQLNRFIVLGFIIILYIFLGCIMDALAMVLITVPIFFPLILSYGFDPIWFGVLIVLVVQMGLITPPVGMNVFVIAGVAKDVPMYTIFRGISYFIIAMLFMAVILVVFPEVALFLPNAMK